MKRLKINLAVAYLFWLTLAFLSGKFMPVVLLAMIPGGFLCGFILEAVPGRREWF